MRRRKDEEEGKKEEGETGREEKNKRKEERHKEEEKRLEEKKFQVGFEHTPYCHCISLVVVATYYISQISIFIT